MYFDGEFFPRSEKPHARNLNGFWLNKVDRKAINEILSIQNVPVSTWIPYLTCYLTNSDRKRQDMLQQFQFVKHIICRVIPMLKNSSLEEQKDMAQSSRELLSMSVSSSQVPEQLKQHTEELVRGSY